MVPQPRVRYHNAIAQKTGIGLIIDQNGTENYVNRGPQIHPYRGDEPGLSISPSIARGQGRGDMKRLLLWMNYKCKPSRQ